jgi:hypothetical protein
MESRRWQIHKYSKGSLDPEVTHGILLASPSINDYQTVISLLKRNERQWNETATRKSFGGGC